MKKIIALFAVGISLTISGCSYVAPNVSQALQLERQTKALERIATALDKGDK